MFRFIIKSFAFQKLRNNIIPIPKRTVTSFSSLFIGYNIQYNNIQNIFSKTILRTRQNNVCSKNKYLLSRYNHDIPRVHRNCWKCNSEIDYLSIHCNRKDCGVIQNVFPNDVTYFEILGVGKKVNGQLQPTYDIDSDQLRKNFLLLQQRVHPDSYSTKEDRQEYNYASQQSSLINKAYQVLRDPLSRAKYMLKLNNISISESESLQDQELLMEILDVREQLEEATNENNVKVIKNESEDKINNILAELSQAFSSNDFCMAKESTVKLQYWYNIRNATIDWQPGKRIEIYH
ncbi:hypothetical protein RclHR1_09810007 [Rhizophagus clarus]|uniref:Iron-sulfur cluster co-chaperone protein HscB, mitochondrial-like n=1 Tax=Rhizophagus clarus TaxID=94130 RepID=A0A2Z6SBG4_9GLOM|nr:hypothetical protein RclHR1_09810007 [Rhizophagus clarus]GES93731.1 iron-sulfur cluster co-chaperone protein HscB, mitochondrial-like [Rhizophagus clarus]